MYEVMKSLDNLRKFRYAHRGYHNKPQIPENSIPAFKRAIERGWGAEFDVHILKDGQLVVFHDNELKRCTGAEGIIEDLTLDEVKNLRLEGTEEQIPTFDEVLALFENSGLPLIIELKHYKKNHLELSKAVINRLDSYKGDFCIESFDPRVVTDFKKLRPDIIRGQLSRDFTKDPFGMSTMNVFLMTDLCFMPFNKPDFVAYMFEDRMNEKNQRAIKNGVQPVSWTIRTKEDMLQAESEGAMVIFECFDPDK